MKRKELLRRELGSMFLRHKPIPSESRVMKEKRTLPQASRPGKQTLSMKTTSFSVDSGN